MHSKLELERERQGVSDRRQAAAASPAAGFKAGLMTHLQTTAGNQAVQRLLGTRRPTHAAVAHPQVSVRNGAVVRGVFRVHTPAEAAALKLRAVEELTKMAEAGFAGVRLLNDQERLDVAAILQAFFMELKSDEIDTLTNATGCNSRPSETLQSNADSLYGFLEMAANNPGTYCGEGFASDAAIWAEHVVTQNPQDASLKTAWSGQQTRIDRVRVAAKGDMKTWWDNPVSRPARTKNEAFYFLAYIVQNKILEEESDFVTARRRLETTFPVAGLDKFTFARAQRFDLAKSRQQGQQEERD
jgi:hypothetical protein